LGSDHGIRLMNLDGQIAEWLINPFTAADLPVAARGVIDHEVEVDCVEFPLDELDTQSPERYRDFMEQKQIPMSEGYVGRL